MKEKQKTIVIAVVFVVLVALLGITAAVGARQEREKLKEFYNYFESSEEKLIYFGRSGCTYCKLLAPAKEIYLDEADIDYYYVDTDIVDADLVDKMAEKLGITRFGTPILAVVKNGKVLDIQDGVFKVIYQDENQQAIDEEKSIAENKTALEAYLKEQNIIK